MFCLHFLAPFFKKKDFRHDYAEFQCVKPDLLHPSIYVFMLNKPIKGKSPVNVCCGVSNLYFEWQFSVESWKKILQITKFKRDELSN